MEGHEHTLALDPLSSQTNINMDQSLALTGTSKGVMKTLLKGTEPKDKEAKLTTTQACLKAGLDQAILTYKQHLLLFRGRMTSCLDFDLIQSAKNNIKPHDDALKRAASRFLDSIADSVGTRALHAQLSGEVNLLRDQMKCLVQVCRFCKPLWTDTKLDATGVSTGDSQQEHRDDTILEIITMLVRSDLTDIHHHSQEALAAEDLSATRRAVYGNMIDPYVQFFTFLLKGGVLTCLQSPEAQEAMKALLEDSLQIALEAKRQIARYSGADAEHKAGDDQVLEPDSGSNPRVSSTRLKPKLQPTPVPKVSKGDRPASSNSSTSTSHAGGPEVRKPMAFVRPRDMSITDILTMRGDQTVDWALIYECRQESLFVKRSLKPATQMEIPKFRKFSGDDILEWPAFKQNVDSCIILKQNLDWPHKQHYLLQMLEGYALRLVEDYPLGRQGFAQVLFVLAEEFGSFNMYKDVLVREVRDLAPLDKQNINTIREARVTLRKVVIYAAQSDCKNPEAWAEALLPIIDMDRRTLEHWDEFLDDNGVTHGNLDLFEEWCKKVINRLYPGTQSMAPQDNIATQTLRNQRSVDPASKSYQDWWSVCPSSQTFQTQRSVDPTIISFPYEEEDEDEEDFDWSTDDRLNEKMKELELKMDQLSRALSQGRSSDTKQ